MAHLRGDAHDKWSLVTVIHCLFSDRVKWRGSCYQFVYRPDGCVAGCRSVAEKSLPTYRSGDAVSFAKA